MINLYKEQESLLDDTRGLIDKYINDTEAIDDKFTLAAYLESLGHYNLKFQERHTEILGLNNVNFNYKYFTDNFLKQASEAHEKTKCFFTDLLISFKGEDVLEYSIEPTRSGTLLYTESCRGLYKNENCALCTDNHSIADCPSFKVLDFRERVSFVADNDLCLIALVKIKSQIAYMFIDVSVVRTCIIVSYTLIVQTFSIVANIIVQRVVVSTPLNKF